MWEKKFHETFQGFLSHKDELVNLDIIISLEEYNRSACQNICLYTYLLNVYVNLSSDCSDSKRQYTKNIFLLQRKYGNGKFIGNK